MNVVVPLTGSAAGDLRRFLADDLGAAVRQHCHDDQAGGEKSGSFPLQFGSLDLSLALQLINLQTQ